MKKIKRLVSSFLVVIMLMTTIITAMPVTSNAATYEAQTVVDLANSKVGQSYTSNACLAFIKDLFKSAYGFTSTACCAYNYGSSYIDSSSRSGIPLGASVFFGGSTVICSNGHNCGHIGIYVGDDYIVHAWDGKIVKYKIDRVINYGYPYRGWGWHGNVTLTHTCNLSGGFKWFLQSHPHHNCYACSICGAVNADTSSSNYYDSCDICVGYPSKPTLTVYTGTSTEDIMFLSSIADFADSYDYRVFDSVTDELVAISYGHQSRLYSMQLPAGEYYANVVGINESLTNTNRWWGTYSDAVSFTVTEGTFEPANSVEYNGHTYELYLNRLSWQNAKAKCEELGGHLATVTSAEEQEIVAVLADGKGAYLGATNETGTWEWITDEEFSYDNWISGEPNNNGHLSEDYLGIYAEGGWNDFDYINQNVSGFICEYDACSHESYTATYTILPTCTEDGEEGRICNDCGEEFLIIDPALGHDWSEWVLTEATCTVDGSNSRSCNRCGETESEVIPATGHSWGEWVTTEPTCTERGSNIRTCDNCGENEVEVIPVTNHMPGEAQIITEPTCTSEGVEIVYCTVCGNTVTMAPVPMLDHTWSEWIQISAPTATEDGEQLRYCKTCKTSETEVIPALGEEPTPDPEPEEPVDPNAPAVISVNNYTITLDKITDIKEIRFAIGHYTTGSEVKAAEKNVTLDASTVKKYTDNGIFTYDLPWMGEYTFWVRYNDGSQYFVYTNVDDITPYVESYGVKLTVKDYAENYKDMWLAEGTFNSYSEIKASTAFKYQASANKLDLYAKTTHDFSYTMTNPGAYTVLIRYNDGTTDVIHTELTVDVPEFSVNGLQTTVQNIPDIKIIRTAYGHYESVGDIKKASGVRNFSNKNDIKNAEEYMIQYREAGEVTLIVEYNNGYKHFCYINIEPKSATMIQSKNTVMFDDLDGFVMIRYAKGTYKTSSQIKAAEGSKVLKPADLVGGYAIISDLEAGTYTFCVQFDDESYDYYTVTVA